MHVFGLIDSGPVHRTFGLDSRLPAGESVYDLEREWIEFWRHSGCPALKSPDAAFIGFCRACHAEGRPKRRARGAPPA